MARALRQIFSFIVKPLLSRLNRDSELSEIRNYDYVDCKDVTNVSQNPNTQGRFMPVISDSLAYNIPAVAAQNKVIQVTIDCSNAESTQTVTIFDINGNQIGTGVTFDIATSLTTTISNFETAFNAVAATYFTITYTNNQNLAPILLITIEFTDVLGYDWNLVSSSQFISVQVLKEAIDASITGQQYILQRWEDPNNNTFLWSTPCNHLPTVVAGLIITAIANNSGAIKLAVNNSALLTAGQSITISKATGAQAASILGTWIVSIIDGTHIGLSHSFFVNTGYDSGSAVVTEYIEGYGQIGVAVKNTNNNTWAYTPLLRTKEFNWRTVWQMDCACQIDNLGYDLKWFDFNNPDGVFYYSTSEGFVPDGAITAINPLGGYAYGVIAAATNLIINTDVGILAFTGQTVGGGSVGSGNWRYGVRGVSLDGNSTSSITYMDILVPVYQAPQNQGGDTPLNLCGDDSTQANVPSSKINNFTLSNIPQGVFKWVELIGTQYIGLAETSYVITRLLLPDNATTFNFSHVGNETDTTLLDSAYLAVVGGVPIIAKNGRLIQNYLYRSNLKTLPPYDLSAFAQSITWGLKRETIQGVGLGSGKDNGDYIYYGEYFDPMNVCNHRSLMINETYRMGIMCHYIKGGWTDVYWSADVKVDVIAAGLSYDLTTSAYQDTQIYSYYFDPYGFNLNTVLSDGRLFRDVFDRIEFCYVPIDQTNATVLASGILAIAINGNPYSPGGATSGYIGEITHNGSLSSTQRKYGSLYFSDIIWGNLNINQVSGDEIINFGNPTDNAYPVTPSGKINPDILNEFNGYTNQTTNTHIQTIAIAALETLDSQNFAMNFNGSGLNYSKLYTLTGECTQSIPTSPIYAVGTNITDGNQAGNTDLGYYMCQYFRPRTNQYGNSTTGNTYITTGAVYYITPQSPSVIVSGTIHVQGDCFTQKSYLRQVAPLDTSTFSSNGGIGWYSQNRINQQMRFEGSPSGLLFPVGVCTVSIWLENSGAEPINYNQGYTPRQQDQTEPAFNPNIPYISEQPTRQVWSEPKANDNLVDSNRYFLPFNFSDLDLSDGEIFHAEVMNKRLITLQPRSTRNPNFNQAGKLEINNPSNIVLGSGSILNTNPNTYTTFGLSNKWAQCLGKSASGDVVFYFLDTKTFKFNRLAHDGIRCLSDEHNMSNWFANNLRFAAGQDTPADNQGINMVWDERRKEVVVVVRAWKKTDPYNSGTTYIIGDEVNFGTQGYDQIPAIYVSLANSNTGNEPDTHPTKWGLQPLTNNNYYNCWSLAYSEMKIGETIKPGFTRFLTPLPRIMIPFSDHYLMPNTISDIGNVYEQWVGNSWLSWYGGALTANGYIEFVVNTNIETEKNLISFLFDTAIIPYQIDVQTETMFTTILASDITANGRQNLIQWLFPILKDVNSGGRMMGKIATVKLYYQSGQYQELIDFAIRWNAKPRSIGN